MESIWDWKLKDFNYIKKSYKCNKKKKINKKSIINIVVTFCHLDRIEEDLLFFLSSWCPSVNSPSEMLEGGKIWHCFNETATVRSADFLLCAFVCFWMCADASLMRVRAGYVCTLCDFGPTKRKYTNLLHPTIQPENKTLKLRLAAWSTTPISYQGFSDIYPI